MTGKFIWAIPFVVAGTIVVIVRLISRATGKLSQNVLIDKLKRNPALAIDVAGELDFPYGKVRVSKEAFDHFKRKLSSLNSGGPYKVLYATSFGHHGVLILTEIIYTNFGITVTGKPADVSDKAFHNFALQYDPISSEASLMSAGFFDTTDKFQKEDFLKQLRELEATPS